MSLIAKIQQQSLLQNKLQAQLAEMSYQAVNGTRQSARNFREGTFEVGKMHFNTPQDRITKEMIMDYQQSQQEKHYDDGTNKLKYEPTGLKDIANVESLLETYTPIPFAPVGYIPLGSAVDENALRVYKTELNDLYNELENMKTVELKKGENKLKRENSQLMIAKTRVQEKIDEMTELGNEINAHKERLKEIQDEISVFHSTTAISGSPGAPTLLKRLQKEEANEIADIKAKEKHLNGTLATELKNEENEVIRYEAAVQKVQKQIEDYKTVNIAAKEKEIEDANLLVIQAQQNLKENQDEMQKVKNKNKEITQKYTDTFNMANRDRYSVHQDINESEEDYLNRIKQIESQPYDPTIFKEKAANEGNLKLKDNLRNSLRDEVKITEIVKTFTPEEVFMINTNWKEIQDQLRVKFGVNNPNKTVKDYNEEIISIIETLQSKPYGTTLLPSDTTTTGSYSTVTKPSGSIQKLVHSDGSASDFESTVENNSLYIKNVNEQKAVWIKIGAYTATKTHVMFSINSNNERNFKAFNFNTSNKYGFRKMIEELKLNLNKNTDIRHQLFGTKGTKDDVYEYLRDTIGLTEVKSKNNIVDGGVTMWGYGLQPNKEAISKHANFGKNIILLDKLYYKNVLSIKDKKMHSIEHLPNVKVSDTLADIIINMCKKINPTKQVLEELSSSERQLFDILLYVSGLGKHIGKGVIENKKDAIIKELKERFKMVEAEIQAGNNNPVVKAELKEIINKLVLYNVISQNNGKKYLQQY